MSRLIDTALETQLCCLHGHGPWFSLFLAVAMRIQVFMRYRGRLAHNNKEFDSNFTSGKPFAFRLGKGEVIKGWDEGVKGTIVKGSCYCHFGVVCVQEATKDKPCFVAFNEPQDVGISPSELKYTFGR